jgi:RNA polymerase subunit RPABC4/transcription elongation factor Spt4
MKKEERKEYLKENPKLKSNLRVVGFFTLIPGILLFISAIFSIMNGTIFDAVWMPFVGMILIGIGSNCLKYGYMGEVTRFKATQIAPVAKDTVNYMIDGTKDEITDLIRKVKSDDKLSRNCRYCGDALESDSLFCDHCGKKVSKTCKTCNKENSDDAKFCRSCGDRLTN